MRQAQHLHHPVVQPQAQQPETGHFHLLPIGHRPGNQRRPVEGRRGRRAEGVVEAAAQFGQRLLGGDCGQRRPQPTVQHPQIVHSHNVIGMAVGEQHRIHPADAVGQTLRPQIRPGIHQQALVAGLDHDRRACAAVARFRRVAGAPVARTIRPPDQRHPARSATAKNGDFQERQRLTMPCGTDGKSSPW